MLPAPVDWEVRIEYEKLVVPVYAAKVEAAVSVVVDVLIVMEAPAATVMLRVDVPVVCASMFGTYASASITAATRGLFGSAKGTRPCRQKDEESADRGGVGVPVLRVFLK